MATTTTVTHQIEATRLAVNAHLVIASNGAGDFSRVALSEGDGSTYPAAVIEVLLWGPIPEQIDALTRAAEDLIAYAVELARIDLERAEQEASITQYQVEGR